MINKDNLKDLLRILNFEIKGDIYSKHFPNIDAYLKVDFKNNVLIYPTDKGFVVNGEFTCNFTSAENFVVFECVHRLFEKGYKPEHIELEPKWKVGHGASGGRADILVKDNSNKSLLIIECKNEGSEFKKEWNNTLQRGGQLFSYVKQAGTTQYVCLYASDFSDGKVIPFQYIISLKDNDKLLEELKDKKPLSFAVAKALEVEDIFKAWKETYNLDYSTKGIFEADILPYQIGKTKFSTSDLLAVGSKDIQSKYHEFATIMRQHNVSGRENAFDKLVNLFLCKIVDENKNPKDLKFNWKGIAYDSYFDLQDRLQLLYQAGMKEFLGEDVTYIDNTAIDKAFRFFKKDPDATRETIKKYFRQLKFFTNNDFAFIDVHNEKLFYQNSEVLLKIVQMLQDIKLQDDNQEHQFLGDMFEGFLDNGVKQSEGQFFTPMPIVKFILNSLPLESMIQESELPPKAIDYACGAGHFLNELALQIKPFVTKYKETDIKEYYKEIVGIEKEYRLSKVAKVSAFMYGQDDIKITYADALGSKAKLQDSEYSVLVANPPYAVKGFLQTLSESERKSFTLLASLDEKSWANNNSIETFFIERAKQLLKPGAVAGIILPSSILSNDATVYTSTREIIFKYFQIVAITEFGSQTFGKTGTNTVTLFLRRKEENPAPADHWKNRVNAWFADKTTNVIHNKDNAVYEDEYLINNYCNHIKINPTDYKTILIGEPNEVLLQNEMFVDYQKAFDNLTEIKNLKKPTSAFSKKPKADQDTELKKRFTEYLQAIEKDKLYFYVLASENGGKVLVVKCPTDNKEQKQFLGYEWSSAKGNEGIKYINQTTVNIEVDDTETKEFIQKSQGLQSINTPLYNPSQRNDTTKINHYIQENFLGNELPIMDSLSSVIAYYNLVDMLDFKRVGFNKQISLSIKKVNTIESKYPMVKLGEVAEVLIGGTPSRAISQYFTGNNLWVSIAEMNGKIIYDTKEKITDEGIKNSNVKLIKKGTTLLSFKLSIGKTAIAGKNLYTNEAIAGLIPLNNTITNEYLFQLFTSKQIDLSTSNNAIGQSLNSKFLREELKIPLPPKDIQQIIVDECNAIDKKVEKASAEIENAKEKVKDLILNVSNFNYKMETLETLSKDMFAGGDAPKSNMSTILTETYTIPIFANGRENKGLYGYTNFARVTEPAITISARGTLGYTEVRKEPFFPIVRLIVVIPNEKINLYFLKHFVNQLDFSNTGGVIPQLTVPNVKNLKIPVPPIAEQNKLVAEIEKLEHVIQTEQAKIDSSADKKKEVIKKYL